VYLNNPEETGTFALASIGISAATTGFMSALLAFDFDVDVPHRKNQPKFYGYIPDDNGLRTRCFVLMTLISALHNVSRSVGCALLATCDKELVVVFVGGEVLLYIAYKVLRGDYFWFVKIDGALAIIVSFVERFAAKIIVDFTGCLHFRHPYVGERAKRASRENENEERSDDYYCIVAPLLLVRSEYCSNI